MTAIRLSSFETTGGGFTEPLGGSAIGFHFWHFRSPLKSPGGYDNIRGNACHQDAVVLWLDSHESSHNLDLTEYITILKRNF
jgi:hypothetical protein